MPMPSRAFKLERLELLSIACSFAEIRRAAVEGPSQGQYQIGTAVVKLPTHATYS